MSHGRSTPAGAGGWDGSQRAAAAVTSAEGVGERSANELTEEMPRAVQVEVNAGMDLLIHTPSNPMSSSRLCPPSPPCSACGAARGFLARTERSTNASSPSRRSSARSSSGEQASSDLARTSGSALEAPARTQDVQESGSALEAPARTQDGKAELPNLLELPHEFATKWPHNDVSATVVASSWNFLSRIATLFPPNFISWTCSLFCLLTVRAVPQ
jgi:hypothetical protein